MVMSSILIAKQSESRVQGLPRAVMRNLSKGVALIIPSENGLPHTRKCHELVRSYYPWEHRTYCYSGTPAEKRAQDRTIPGRRKTGADPHTLVDSAECGPA